MLIEKVGQLNEEEKNYILNLYQRKLALNELMITLGKAKFEDVTVTYLYEKIVKDLGETKAAFDKWWAETPGKYKWKASANGHWTINFDTSEVFLNEV